MSDSLCSFAPFPKALLNKGIRPSALLVYVALSGEVSEIYLRVPVPSLKREKNLPDPAGNPEGLGIRATPPETWSPPSGNLEANKLNQPIY